MAADIQSAVNEIVARSRDLCERMRSSERHLLNAADLQALLAELHILQNEALSVQKILLMSNLQKPSSDSPPSKS